MTSKSTGKLFGVFAVLISVLAYVPCYLFVQQNSAFPLRSYYEKLSPESIYMSSRILLNCFTFTRSGDEQFRLVQYPIAVCLILLFFAPYSCYCYWLRHRWPNSAENQLARCKAWSLFLHIVTCLILLIIIYYALCFPKRHYKFYPAIKEIYSSWFGFK